MSRKNAIQYGIFDGFTWIRCEGKGSFLESSDLKACAEKRREEGESHFVIDLEGCTGMDSTFMGFLAGLARRVKGQDGAVEIAGADDRNRSSLEDLGLDHFVDVNPDHSVWQGREEELRGELEVYDNVSTPNSRARARHVLESHRTLAETSDENAARFRGVIDVMKQEVSDESDSP